MKCQPLPVSRAAAGNSQLHVGWRSTLVRLPPMVQAQATRSAVLRAVREQHRQMSCTCEKTWWITCRSPAGDVKQRRAMEGRVARMGGASREGVGRVLPFAARVAIPNDFL